mmetsp:Transcript_74142/g.197686  ORF Transcript_74142/g.197686 Transcript_74142/m.197686 type:complete len:170 (+) Transcript_74142:26-535(+)
MTAGGRPLARATRQRAHKMVTQGVLNDALLRPRSASSSVRSMSSPALPKNEVLPPPERVIRTGSTSSSTQRSQSDARPRSAGSWASGPEAQPVKRGAARIGDSRAVTALSYGDAADFTIYPFRTDPYMYFSEAPMRRTRGQPPPKNMTLEETFASTALWRRQQGTGRVV